MAVLWSANPVRKDRRMRQLRLTQKGSALEAALWEAQRPRLVRAFREAGPDAVAGFPPRAGRPCRAERAHIGSA